MLYHTTPDTLFTPTSAIDPIGYGKTAIVTGCASGIGLSTTQLLLAHQFSVCGLDISDFDYNLLRVEDHGRFHFHKGDLTSPGACEEGVRICVAAFGFVPPPLDISFCFRPDGIFCLLLEPWLTIVVPVSTS